MRIVLTDRDDTCTVTIDGASNLEVLADTLSALVGLGYEIDEEKSSAPRAGHPLDSRSGIEAND